MEDPRYFYKHRSKELDIRKLNAAIDNWVREERKRGSTNGQMRHRIIREIVCATGVSRARAEHAYWLFLKIRKTQALAKMSGSDARYIMKDDRLVEVLLMLRKAESRSSAVVPEGPSKLRKPRGAICIAPIQSANDHGRNQNRYQGCLFDLNAHQPWWERWHREYAKIHDPDAGGR
ncbi:hypothetical protein EFQ99_16395 [Rhizobium vallis]|uniref:Uncharacterized protein n=1 Tax=Rhizobium vallis TaxID=634290 RepID=A0A432PJR4_9HYPH|nr:hypothetical protein [Rhizobium vallis]RUM24366.1 hypothetical protein EFQ99_16395 [Rhizobium vallis]